MRAISKIGHVSEYGQLVTGKAGRDIPKCAILQRHTDCLAPAGFAAK